MNGLGAGLAADFSMFASFIKYESSSRMDCLRLRRRHTKIAMAPRRMAPPTPTPTPIPTFRGVDEDELLLEVPSLTAVPVAAAAALVVTAWVTLTWLPLMVDVATTTIVVPTSWLEIFVSEALVLGAVEVVDGADELGESVLDVGAGVVVDVGVGVEEVVSVGADDGVVVVEGVSDDVSCPVEAAEPPPVVAAAAPPSTLLRPCTIPSPLASSLRSQDSRPSADAAEANVQRTKRSRINLRGENIVADVGCE